MFAPRKRTIDEKETKNERMVCEEKVKICSDLAE